MKKSVKILAVALSLLMVLGLFVACSPKLSGTYVCDATAGGDLKSGAETTLEFSGSKVTCTIKTYLLGNVTSTDVLEGKYEIAEKEDGTQEITITYDVKNDADLEKPETSTAVLTEDEETGSIKIGLITYKKQ